MRSLLILLAALFLQNLALGDTTRHQLSKGPNLSPMMGYRYFNSVNEDGAGGLPSDGSAVFMRDSVEWSLGQGHAFNFQNEARFLLRGSGVDIAYVADPRGELMQYELYDAVDGNSGNIVQSGSVDTNATTPALRIETVATSGTLNPDRLYLLKIKVADTDSSTTRRIIFLDAIDVKSEAPITLSDNTDAAWQFNNFDANLPESNSIGQGRAAGNAAGGSISYTFSGTSLAVFTFMDAGVGGTFNWQIDGGLHGSGTIDQTLDYDFTRRFVEILVNDLPAAHHTLTITATGDANAGLFPGHSAYAQIDAIATIFTEVEPVTAARHWSLLQ